MASQGRSPHGIRGVAFIACLAAWIGAAACGGSASTYTAPSVVSKCALTVGSTGSTIPPAGGSGSITVTAARECQWTASADSDWLSVTEGASGQGDGAVQFKAAPNPDPITRTGGIVVNGQRSAVSQAAAECRFDVSPSSADFPADGGTGTAQVSASSQRCSWTATSSDGWIALRSSTGSGSAAVTFTVAPSTGTARRGTVIVAGVTVNVSQAQATPSPAPAPPSPTPTPSPTPSPAPSPAPMPAPDPTPAPTPPPSPTPSPTPPDPTPVACRYDVAPISITAPASGSTSAITINTAATCQWTATSNVPWIAVRSPSAGSGNGTVQLDVQANTSAARIGTVTVAGQTVTVTQDAPALACTYSVTPASVKSDLGGGTESVTVHTQTGCAWTATSNVVWITITSGAAGAGSGTVEFRVAETQSDRSGTLTVAGQIVTVTQKAKGKAATPGA